MTSGTNLRQTPTSSTPELKRSLLHPRLSPLLWIVIAIFVVASVGTSIVFHETVGYWGRLEKVADRVPPPRGFTLVKELRLGTTVCVISCDEARIEFVYRTGLSPKDACRVLRAHLQRYVGRTQRDPYNTWCGYAVPLTGVGHNARASAAAFTPSDIREFSGALWQDLSKQSDTVAWITFTSGLD